VNKTRIALGASTLVMAQTTVAGGVVPPVVPLGVSLGTALGSVLGTPLGIALPMSIDGLLIVAAASLVAGIWIVKRKRAR
jgi:predicted MFS family arabinose efflux permease